MKKLLLLTLLPFLVLTGCGGENWTGFFYPQGVSTGIYDMRGGFSSKEECFNWISLKKKENEKYNQHQLEDYECGLNCKKDYRFDGYICDKTLKE